LNVFNIQSTTFAYFPDLSFINLDLKTYIGFPNTLATNPAINPQPICKNELFAFHLYFFTATYFH